MKIGPALAHLHSSQRDLADELRALAERHATDHDVYHVGGMLAERCDQLAKGLGPFEAAAAGVLAHVRAGDHAARRLGADHVIAGDVIEAIPAGMGSLAP